MHKQVEMTENIRTFINGRRVGDALFFAKRHPSAVTDSQVMAIHGESPLEAAKVEVLRILARVADSHPAILDTLRAGIGADENDWDLGTPARLRMLVEQSTRLIG